MNNEDYTSYGTKIFSDRLFSFLSKENNYRGPTEHKSLYKRYM